MNASRSWRRTVQQGSDGPQLLCVEVNFMGARPRCSPQHPRLPGSCVSVLLPLQAQHVWAPPGEEGPRTEEGEPAQRLHRSFTSRVCNTLWGRSSHREGMDGVPVFCVRPGRVGWENQRPTGCSHCRGREGATPWRALDECWVLGFVSFPQSRQPEQQTCDPTSQRRRLRPHQTSQSTL